MESAAWAAVDGIATNEQLALLEADAPGWRRALERMLDDTEENLDAVRDLSGPERDQVVSDLEAELERLELAYDRLTGASDAADAVLVAPDPVGEVRLQASWSANEVVVWAGGSRHGAGVPRRPVRPPRRHRRPRRGVEPAPGRPAAHGRPGGRAVDPRGRRPRLAGRRRGRSRRRRRRVQRDLAGPGGRVCGADGGPRGHRARPAQQPPVRRPHARPPRPLDPRRRRPRRGRGAGRGDARPGRRHVAGRRQGGRARGGPGGRRRHRLRRRRPRRDARAASGRPHRGRRGRGRDHPPRRFRLRRSRRRRARGVQAARALGQAGHRRRALAAGRAARSSRLERRLVPLGARARRRGRPAADRARPHRQPVDQADGRRPGPPRAPLPGAAAGGWPAPGPGVPEAGRGVGADDGHGRHARGRRLRRAGARPVAADAVTHAAPVHHAVGRHGRRRPPALRRALVGGVRRRRADRGRHLPPGRRGPAPDPLTGTVGRARPGRPEGGGGRPGRAGRPDPHERGRDPAPRRRASRGRRWRAV